MSNVIAAVYIRFLKIFKIFLTAFMQDAYISHCIDVVFLPKLEWMYNFILVPSPPLSLFLSRCVACVGAYQ